MEKLTYAEFSKRMRAHMKEHPDPKEALIGVIVIDQCSFTKEYSVESRSYRVSSDNKAYKPCALGYSIWGDSLDGTDTGVRLEAYLKEEKGGPDGWVVEYCYFV